MNNSTLTPIDHSTAARAPAKPKAISKLFTNRLATKQARVEAEMKRLETELEQTRARLVSLSSDSDSPSEQSLPIKSGSFHKNNGVSGNSSISPPTTISGTQNNVSAMNGPPSNEPTVSQRDLEQVKTDLQNSFDLLL